MTTAIVHSNRAVVRAVFIHNFTATVTPELMDADSTQAGPGCNA